MADVVTSQTLASGPRYAILHLTNISDGTGESGVAKVTLSGLVRDDGVTVTRTGIKEVQWSMQGFSYVKLYWDHTSPQTAAVLGAGVGYLEWGALGMLSDPATAGGTGNLLLTTGGAVSGATYDITLTLVLA